MWPARRTRSSPVASHPSIAPGLLTSRRRRFRVGARSSRRDGVYLQPAHHSDRTRSAMGSELWSAPPPGKGRRSRPFLWKGGPASQKDVSRPSVGSHPSERRPAYEARLWQEQKQQMLDPTQGGLHRPLPKLLQHARFNLAAKLGALLTYNVIFETKLFLRLSLTYRLSAQRRIPACGASIWAPFNTGH